MLKQIKRYEKNGNLVTINFCNVRDTYIVDLFLRKKSLDPVPPKQTIQVKDRGQAVCETITLCRMNNIFP